ncbi:MAG: CPBP family intramembrane metalloprotease [Saprospiraceae bacterium]|nr:CPBP family intramembrane metalloprotease [Saprospiraceae bacterium]
MQSAGEEVLTRAYLISMLETRLGTIVAIVLSGSLFAVLHIGNDHFTWIGFVNILLGGFIMALLFVEYRSIWVCTGYHAGWNFLQAGLLDFNVSGVDVYSLVQWKDIGYPRLTGSSFGYEGSLVAVLLQGVLLAYLLKNNSIELNNPFTNSNVQEVPPADNDYDTLISDEVKTES